MARLAEVDRVHQGRLSIRRAIDRYHDVMEQRVLVWILYTEGVHIVRKIERWRSLPPALPDRWTAWLSAHLIVRPTAW
jgi:hypothetical protein